MSASRPTRNGVSITVNLLQVQVDMLQNEKQNFDKEVAQLKEENDALKSNIDLWVQAVKEKEDLVNSRNKDYETLKADYEMTTRKCD